MSDLRFGQLWGYPRTRCDVGQGPLWCLLMGGPSATDYHRMRVALAGEILGRRMRREST